MKNISDEMQPFRRIHMPSCMGLGKEIEAVIWNELETTLYEFLEDIINSYTLDTKQKMTPI